jgi:FtsZ-binding cell division protein ZapB
VKNTEADVLWAESKQMRLELKEEVTSLRQQYNILQVEADKFEDERNYWKSQVAVIQERLVVVLAQLEECQKKVARVRLEGPQPLEEINAEEDLVGIRRELSILRAQIAEREVDR